MTQCLVSVRQMGQPEKSAGQIIASVRLCIVGVASFLKLVPGRVSFARNTTRCKT